LAHYQQWQRARETPTKQLGNITNQFASLHLSAAWQWPVTRQPKVRVGDGRLTLTVGAQREDSLADSLGSSGYLSSVLVQPNGDALGSLTVIGNVRHSFRLGRNGPALQLWQQDGQSPRTVVWHQKVPDAAVYIYV
jgi:hypothetical protein